MRIRALCVWMAWLPALAAPLPGAACPPDAASASAGFDALRLCAALREFDGDTANFHGLVIERHGRVVAEAYRRGKDKSIYSLFARTIDFDASARHDVRSISKSVTSLLWGIAQGQHKTPPLTTPALSLFPDLGYLNGEGRQAITLGHLFSMSSGMAWHEPNRYDASNDEIGLYWHSSQPRYVFKRPMAAPAGTVFNYNGGGTAVLALLLEQRTGMPLPDFARRYLFEPLGIRDWEWQSDVRGRPLAFAGLRMRPRDLARIGRMVLQRGQWGGRQVVPTEWIEESTQARIDTGDGLRYGYHWWGGTVAAKGTAYAWSAGFGNGGQRLFVVPGLDLVVVITAGDYDDAAIGPRAYRLFQRIAAAVRDQGGT
jgi:CubicO group peptidase (beta-lactamase class C family)